MDDETIFGMATVGRAGGVAKRVKSGRLKRCGWPKWCAPPNLENGLGKSWLLGCDPNYTCVNKTRPRIPYIKRYIDIIHDLYLHLHC